MVLHPGLFGRIKFARQLQNDDLQYWLFGDIVARNQILVIIQEAAERSTGANV